MIHFSGIGVQHICPCHGGTCSVLCYISRRSKETSYKAISLADPTTLYDEVSTNKKMREDAMEMNTNTAYGSHVS